MNNNGIHDNMPLLHTGVEVDGAKAVALLLHGRGGTAEDFLALARWIDVPGVAYLVPQAAGRTWYPYSFLAPIAQNQPDLDSALSRVESIVTALLKQSVASDRIAIVGFSQGACLASEFAAQHPRRYGAVAALTGGLIGPPDTPRDYPGSLAGTPVFLGASDPDPHVPWTRVEETSRVLSGMGAKVELKRYANHPHMIGDDQMEHVKTMIAAIAGA